MNQSYDVFSMDLSIILLTDVKYNEMFDWRQFFWSSQNLLEEITDITWNLIKWNILLIKGKKINRDFESSGERNWNLSLMHVACIFLFIKP